MSATGWPWSQGQAIYHWLNSLAALVGGWLNIKKSQCTFWSVTDCVRAIVDWTNVIQP